MLVPLVLLAFVAGRADACGSSRPVAPDMTSARSIAEQTIRDHAASRAVPEPADARPSYRLVVEADPGDANQWSAYQVPSGPGSHRGGGGLEFRIDRCTGAISGMRNAR